MNDKTAAQQIDEIIKMHGGWKAQTLSSLRATIKQADSEIVEEIKWKMPTRPEGLAVWSHSGIVCFAEVWKDNIKLIFFKGARLKDTNNLFNSRLKSKDIRAIEVKEHDQIDGPGLQELVRQAVQVNTAKS